MVKSYKLFIHPDDLKTLKKDIWNDDSVPGTLKVDDARKYFIDVSYRGDSTRKYKKKSYQITFNKPFLYNQNHVIHLNGISKDPSFIRYELSFAFFKRLGVTTPEAKHVLLYLNGQFKGLYLELESFDEFFLKKRNLPDGYIFYATDNHANFSLLADKEEAKTHLFQGYTKKFDIGGKGQEILTDFIYKINTLSNTEFKEEIPKYIDIQKYLKWLAGLVCIQNFDGFIHNYCLYWNKTACIFDISPWDCDGTWGRNRHGEILPYNYIPIEGYNTLSARLLDIPEFRRLYREIIEDILLNSFTEEQLAPLIFELSKDLIPWIEREPYLQVQQSAVEKEQQIILQYIKNRNHYLSSQINRIS